MTTQPNIQDLMGQTSIEVKPDPVFSDDIWLSDDRFIPAGTDLNELDTATLVEIITVYHEWYEHLHNKVRFYKAVG